MELPKIVSGPVSVVYKGKEIPIGDGKILDAVKVWQESYQSERERHKKALEKLESDMDKVMGVT